jgi:tetratricopeptide (TPR) repeat protein
LSGDDRKSPELRQDVAPAGDGYVAGRDMHVHIHGSPAAPYPPAAEPCLPPSPPYPLPTAPYPPPTTQATAPALLATQASLPATSAGPRAQVEPARIWGTVPARNPAFTGRGELLAQVRAALMSGAPVAVQALRGMGGVGKTQIAIEYAHRHAADYDVVWWLNAENAALLGEQFAVLAAELCCADPSASLDVVQRAVLGELHRRPRWLLIFDNATQPDDVRDWLPGGAGHVLIASRSYGWEEVAVPVDVDVLTRAESAAILRNRVAGLSEQEADSAAGAVGDLPLAVAQAACYLAETKMPAGQYVALLKTRAADLLNEGKPPSYPSTLAAVTRLAYDRLRAEDEGAADIAAICAFLAPEPVPVEWFTRAADELPDPLANRMTDPLTRSRLLARLSRSSLARLDPDGLTMHRLTQAILRGRLPPDQADAVRSLAEKLIAARAPGDPALPGNWPAWARVLPHLLAIDPAVSDHLDLRNVALNAAWYVTRRGDAEAGHDLAEQLYERWRERIGPDDEHTLWAASILANALSDMGRYAQARQLDEDVLARRRRVWGADHRETLISTGNLASCLYVLGETAAARELYEDTLARRRRVLGADHPETLVSAIGLAFSLRKLGEFQAARELDEDAFARSSRVLGTDHPATLVAASALAYTLREMGEYSAARDLDEDTLRRRRRVLGEEHPDTRQSAANLAADLQALGEPEAGSG